ncbi:MAG: 3-deoxy-D-manno-octulosonic acid transferase [Pseudomonadota bacterium]
MSEFGADALMRIYRGLGHALYPFAGLALRRRANRGKEDRDRRYERYGYASRERPEGPLVWLHAASVGESLAIMPLIQRLEGHGIPMVLTTGTVTSAGVVAERLAPTTIHQYVPLDMPKAVARFIDHWKPDLAIFAESELWPVTIQELAKRRVPQVLVNARMSDRSNKRWHKRKALAHRVMSPLSLVIAQSALDADRFRSLGAPHVREAGNLKIDVEQPTADEKALATLQGETGNRPVWIAVSTHAGEEAAMARAHRAILQHRPDALLVLVPRHPERAEAVAALLREDGFAVSRRSAGEPTQGAHILLGDSIGEMGLFLRLATVAFMGKSLGVDGKATQGGQNPIEPVLTGAAILSGRYVQNFRETYERLVAAKAIRLVADDRALAAHVLHLWANPDEMAAMRVAANTVLDSMRGALDRSVEALEPFVLPLRLKAQLEARAARGRA